MSKSRHKAAGHAATRRSRPTAVPSAAAQAAGLLLALCPRVMQTVRRRLHEQGQPPGVTVTQQRILRFVAHHPGVSLTELALQFMVSAPSASSTVNRLARQRLLRIRTPASNRRKIAVSLTAAGQALVDRSLSATQQEVELRLEPIPMARLRRLVPILKTLLRNFQ
jgi:DNA-binding MarR family transcriptional regulator